MNGVIVHKSRSNRLKMTWAAGNATPWSFEARDDGEIYVSALNNLSGYLIAGASAILPYPVVRGISYSITPILSNSALPASLEIKSRRAIDYSADISVPDLLAFDGRYLYGLFSTANIVRKMDTALMTPANYAGAGSWTVSPVVATINLPTLPNSTPYTTLTFVKSNGVGKMLITGLTNGTFKFYASFIASNDLCYDLPMTNVGSYTQLLNSPTIYNAGIAALYDFVSELIYVKSFGGANGSNVVVLNLSTLTASSAGYTSFVDNVIPNTIRPHQFIPALQRWSYVADLSLINSQFFNYKQGQNGGTLSSYQHSLGTTDRHIGSLATSGLFNQFGTRIASVGMVPEDGVYQYGMNEVITLDVLGSIFSVNANYYTILNYKGGVNKGRLAQNIPSGATALKSVMGSNYAGRYFAVTQGTSVSRIHVFDTTQSPADFGYIEFAEPLNQIHTNQLII